MPLTDINAERAGAFVGHRYVRHRAVGKIGDHNSSRSRRSRQRRATGFGECAIQITAAQQDRNCARNCGCALVQDGKVRHAVSIQVSRGHRHGISSDRDGRTGGLGESDIQILINGTQQNGYVVRALICDREVHQRAAVDGVAAVPKICADHGDRGGFRNRGGIRQLEGRARKLRKCSVSISPEKRDGIVTLIGDGQVQKTVTVEISDDHGPGIIPNSKRGAQRFGKESGGFAAGVAAPQ